MGQPRPYLREIAQPLLTPDDGLLLGNGDLSVSVYQDADHLIWRFGKNDVWDRRLDLSDDPRPAHIDEVTRGIREEGWKCGPYWTSGPPVATRGTANPQRMRELCRGTPPSYEMKPYPCPKPVGELALHLPPDQQGLAVRHRHHLDQGRLETECTWDSGLLLSLECFIPPKPNVLVVSWSLKGWSDEARTGLREPVWFSLYRWADPTVEEYRRRFFARHRHPMCCVRADSKVTPLPPPRLRCEDGLQFIEQCFPAERTFPDGFSYLMVPFLSAPANTGGAAWSREIEPVDSPGEARLHLMPHQESTGGWLALVIPTTSDPDGPLAEALRIRELVTSDPDQPNRWRSDTLQAAAAFWARSSVRVDDPLLESLWYDTLHALRCVYRPDVDPPGLFFPSSLGDYSHWHGDYHTNYNLQEPFWGCYAANQIELGDAYFRAMGYFLKIGRKIARDYYGARGAFIQLTGYPIDASDDPLGCVPMGRMAYMTGWAANQYWWRYLYTRDRDWLRTTGYPAIRECALFYADFLKKGDDGRYHAFPSNQGEDGFTGDPKDYTDRPQIIRHARYCLRAALSAAQELGDDPDLQSEWADRLAHLAPEDGKPAPAPNAEERERFELCPPEFLARDGGAGRSAGQPSPLADPTHATRVWYFGQYSWVAMIELRSGTFDPQRDFAHFRDNVRRWRHPNGLVWAMSIANYGHCGGWTESLGVIAPLQEMMLQSWRGVLEVFPAWPKSLAASFTGLRAEGAFLIDAGWKDGAVAHLRIHSEKGAVCRLRRPWPGPLSILDERRTPVPYRENERGEIAFETRPGECYTAARG